MYTLVITNKCNVIQVVFVAVDGVFVNKYLHLFAIRTKKLLCNSIKVKVVKNKMAPPFRIALFEITFGKGISRTGEIIDLAVEKDIIQKSGSWYAYNDTKIAQGKESAKAFLSDNPEVSAEIEAKIKAFYVSTPAPEPEEVEAEVVSE